MSELEAAPLVPAEPALLPAPEYLLQASLLYGDALAGVYALRPPLLSARRQSGRLVTSQLAAGGDELCRLDFALPTRALHARGRHVDVGRSSPYTRRHPRCLAELELHCCY